MKAYKLEILVIDFDGMGAENIKDVLESARYPNHCINPDVMEVKEVEIGEWEDKHPLNYIGTRKEYYEKFIK